MTLPMRFKKVRYVPSKFVSKLAKSVVCTKHWRFQSKAQAGTSQALLMPKFPGDPGIQISTKKSGVSKNVIFYNVDNKYSILIPAVK